MSSELYTLESSSFNSHYAPVIRYEKISNKDCASVASIAMVWQGIIQDKATRCDYKEYEQLRDCKFNLDLIIQGLQPNSAPCYETFLFRDVFGRSQGILQMKDLQADSLEITCLATNPVNIHEKEIDLFLLRSAINIARNRNRRSMIVLPLRSAAEFYLENGFSPDEESFHMIKSI